MTWDSLELPDLPAPWAYGDAIDASSDGGGAMDILRDGHLVGGFEMWVFQPIGWPSDLAAGLNFLREGVLLDARPWAATNAEDPAVRDIPFGAGTGVRFAYRAIPPERGLLVVLWHYDGRAVWRITTSWPANPESGSPAFFDAATMLSFEPVLEAFVAGLGLPPTLPTSAPFPN